MPTTQAQINALLTSAKPDTTRALTDLHRLAQPGAHLAGLRRTYQPLDEEGERLPPEQNFPQVVVEDLFPDIVAILGRLWDLQLTQDRTNCDARADIIVDGQTLLAGVPATSLLFLEKQLADVRTIIRKLPKLDPAERWTRRDDAGERYYESAPAETVRTKKVPKAFTKWAPPGPEYTQPAQVEIFTEDTPLGTYTSSKLSGAVPGDRVRQLDQRVTALIDAVKVAREQANATEVTDLSGRPLLAWLFASS